MKNLQVMTGCAAAYHVKRLRNPDIFSWGLRGLQQRRGQALSIGRFSDRFRLCCAIETSITECTICTNRSRLPLNLFYAFLFLLSLRSLDQLSFFIVYAKVCMAVCMPPRAAPNFAPYRRKNGELPLTVTRRFTCVCGGEGGI